MIVLGGFSRFPIFYSSDGKRVLGFQSRDHDFNDFVKLFRSKYIAIKSFENLKYKSRFVLKRKAINPELNKEYDLPEYIYVFPNKKAVKVIINVLAYGIILKGGKKPIFIPLLTRRMLTREEIDAIICTKQIMEFGLNRLQSFLDKLSIRYFIEKELADNRYVIKLCDPKVSNEYCVLIDQEMKIIDLDFCMDNFHNLFLPELIMIVRESRMIHHTTGFSY
jgi:hypothetical protein